MVDLYIKKRRKAVTADRQLHIRVTASFIKDIQDLIKSLEDTEGVRFSKSQVIRRAINLLIKKTNPI